MKAPKFREFITEAKGDSKLKLLIITDEPEQAKQFHTADRLKEEADKLKIESYLFHLSGGYTQFEDGIRTFHNKKDDKGFVIDNNTILEEIIRQGHEVIYTTPDWYLDYSTNAQKGKTPIPYTRRIDDSSEWKYYYQVDPFTNSTLNSSTSLIVFSETKFRSRCSRRQL